ncbi:hypothetical protein DFH06DRAFT_1136231 [Mycena polygramma]|nr:hypothetical protein DFH06DRAFT_1136231 [Mycena polygramma]
MTIPSDCTGAVPATDSPIHLAVDLPQAAALSPTAGAPDSAPSPRPEPHVHEAHIHACGPWTAERMFSVVPPSPLSATTESDETWYAITRGRFIGVTDIHALDQAATLRVSGAAHKGYPTQAAALRTLLILIHCLHPSLTLPTAPFPAYTYLCAVSIVERTVLLFPWGTPLRQTAVFHFPASDITLRDLGCLEGNFYASPGRCSICPKPHFRHSALPGVSFTVLVACPHHPDTVGATDPLWALLPNKAVAALLPEELKHKTCRGNLVVIKHTHPDGGLVANQNLPVLDINEGDIPHIDELLGSQAIRPSSPSGLEHRPCRRIGRLSVPCYDIDEIFASLTLEERRRASPPAPRTRPPPQSPPAPATPPPPPATPPPRYSRRADVTGVPSRSSGAIPPPRTPTTPAATSSSADPQVYVFHTPTRCGRTTAWSEAANATQGIPNSTVHGSPRSKRRGGKKAVAETEAATSGVRFALQQGYSSKERARDAFEIAQANGWTCASDSWSAIPVSSSLAPKPWPQQTMLSSREDSDPCLECALNVLGIESQAHERVPTLEAAQENFARALRKGEVHSSLPDLYIVDFLFSLVQIVILSYLSGQ